MRIRLDSKRQKPKNHLIKSLRLKTPKLKNKAFNTNKFRLKYKTISKNKRQNPKAFLKTFRLKTLKLKNKNSKHLVQLSSDYNLIEFLKTKDGTQKHFAKT